MSGRELTSAEVFRLQALWTPYPWDGCRGGPPVMTGLPRSGKWPSCRARHLKRQPVCQACGCTVLKLLNVHHIKPFQWFPELELDPGNLITLCERPQMSCHWIFGHGGKSWAVWNAAVVETCAAIKIMRESLNGMPDPLPAGA